MWYVLFYILCQGRYQNPIWYRFPSEPTCDLSVLFNRRFQETTSIRSEWENFLLSLNPYARSLDSSPHTPLLSFIQWSSRGIKEKGHLLTLWNNTDPLFEDITCTTKLVWQGLRILFWTVIELLQLEKKLISEYTYSLLVRSYTTCPYLK